MDLILDILLRIVLLPYELWKAGMSQFRMGESKYEENIGRFWAVMSLLAALLVCLGVVIWLFFI